MAEKNCPKLIHEECAVHGVMENFIVEVRRDIKDLFRIINGHRDEIRHEITELKMAVQDIKSKDNVTDDILSRIGRLEEQVADLINTRISRRDVIIIVSVIGVIISLLSFILRFHGGG